MLDFGLSVSINHFDRMEFRGVNVKYLGAKRYCVIAGLQLFGLTTFYLKWESLLRIIAM